jgi:hypothetical protein
MANNCSNWLVVEGPAADIARFKEDAQEDKVIPPVKLSENYTSAGYHYKTALSLEKLVPYPEEHEDNSWREKRLSYWGTKCDIEADIANETETSIAYSFESAWSPPHDALVAIALKYPTLGFTNSYDEPGNGFWGDCAYHGNMICDTEGEYVPAICWTCGNEQSIGPPRDEEECRECGGYDVVTEEAYNKELEELYPEFVKQIEEDYNA